MAIVEGTVTVWTDASGAPERFVWEGTRYRVSDTPTPLDLDHPALTQTYGEDWEMWVRIAAHHPVWYEPEPLAVYRKHGISLSGRAARMAVSGNVRTRGLPHLRRSVQRRTAGMARAAHLRVGRAARGCGASRPWWLRRRTRRSSR